MKIQNWKELSAVNSGTNIEIIQHIKEKSKYPSNDEAPPNDTYGST